jgi:hypothetical protein
MVDETITEADIWADIDRQFAVPMREAGDLDTRQFMERYDISDTSARRRMNKLVKIGEWEWVLVADLDSASGMRKVIRRMNK